MSTETDSTYYTPRVAGFFAGLAMLALLWSAPIWPRVLVPVCTLWVVALSMRAALDREAHRAAVVIGIVVVLLLVAAAAMAVLPVLLASSRGAP